MPSNSNGTIGNEIYEAGPAERAYCTPSTYLGAVNYYHRTSHLPRPSNHLTQLATEPADLGAAPIDAFPIRYARSRGPESERRKHSQMRGETDAQRKFQLGAAARASDLSSPSALCAALPTMPKCFGFGI